MAIVKAWLGAHSSPLLRLFFPNGFLKSFPNGYLAASSTKQRMVWHSTAHQSLAASSRAKKEGGVIVRVKNRLREKVLQLAAKPHNTNEVFHQEGHHLHI